MSSIYHAMSKEEESAYNTFIVSNLPQNTVEEIQAELEFQEESNNFVSEVKRLYLGCSEEEKLGDNLTVKHVIKPPPNTKARKIKYSAKASLQAATDAISRRGRLTPSKEALENIVLSHLNKERNPTFKKHPENSSSKKKILQRERALLRDNKYFPVECF